MLSSKIQSKIKLLWSDAKSEMEISFPFLLSKKPLDSNVLMKSILDFKKNNLSPTEIKSFEAIEAMRTGMIRNKQTIPKMEYGSGSQVFENNTETEKISAVCRIASKKQSACLLLYHLLKNLKPEHGLELGTCLGISAAYQAEALRHNQKGKLTTMEGSIGRAGVASTNIEALHLNQYVDVVQGRFQDILGIYLQKHQYLDYAFIDGHHQEEATLNYYNQLLPWFKKGGVMVFDDIFWSPGMNRAWQTIKNSGKFSATVEYKGMGFGVLA